MPWVYTFAFDPLSAPWHDVPVYNQDGDLIGHVRQIHATQIQDDWRSVAGNQISHQDGGMTVHPDGRGAVVSTPREPNYADFAANFGYVNGVAEHKEIPADRSGSTPLGNGFEVQPRR